MEIGPGDHWATQEQHTENIADDGSAIFSASRSSFRVFRGYEFGGSWIERCLFDFAQGNLNPPNGAALCVLR